MSFATETKEELIREGSFRHSCCRAAFSAGLLFSAEAEGKRVMLRLTGKNPAEYCAEVLRKQYGQAPEVTVRSRFGAELCTLTFSSSSAARTAMEFADSTVPLAQQLRFGCEFCRGQFFRAVFLCTGTVSDPEKENYLEFLFRDAAHAAKFYPYLTEAGLAPRPINRKSGCGLYFRSGGGVEDVFRLIGANKKLFDLLNVRIEKEISNNENRATNCVTRNIGKTVAASVRQTAAVEKLIDAAVLDRLPEELRVTALLRIHHPDATLGELAALHDPPISKSGLNHRLARLCEEADNLSEKSAGKQNGGPT